MKQIIFYSFKGGTGRTTIAANLAYELANRGYKVGVLDLDIYSSGISLLFNRVPPAFNRYFQDLLTVLIERILDQINRNDYRQNINYIDLFQNINYDEYIIDYNRYCRNCFQNRGNLYLIPSTNKILRAEYNLLGEVLNRRDIQYNDLDYRINQGIGFLIRSLRNHLENRYNIDYFILDSTSGFSELSITPFQHRDVDQYLIIVLRNDKQSVSGTKYFLSNPTMKTALTANFRGLYILFNMVPLEEMDEEIRNSYESITNNLEYLNYISANYGYLKNNDLLKRRERIFLEENLDIQQNDELTQFNTIFRDIIRFVSFP